jgi:Tetratricopeptide repeat
MSGHADLFVLSTFNFLGSLYLKQERIAEGEKMYERALTRRRRLSVPNNEEPLAAAVGLAKIYTLQNRPIAAEEM